jgi:RimJ/RimL family protein N-acetyltransferase
MLVGRSVYLTDLQEQHLDSVYIWKNDFELGDLILAPPYPTGHEDVIKWKRLNQEDQKQVLFGVFCKENSRCIGIARLMFIDWISRTAEIGLYIGNKEDRGKAMGKETLSLLLDYAFERLNLRKTTLKVLETNITAVKCYESCGFKQEGLLKNHVWVNGEYRSVKLMSKFKQ